MEESRSDVLWLKIDQLHLKFLKMEDKSDKLKLRSELEKLVAQYLSLVPHSRKFVSATTSDLINTSIKCQRAASSLSKTSEALQAVEEFAANLVKQPQRKKLWKILQYTGFYKHQVEPFLPGAQRLFTEMKKLIWLLYSNISK